MFSGCKISLGSGADSLSNRKELKRILAANGSVTCYHVTKETTHLITNDPEVKDASSSVQICSALKAGVHIVSEEWIIASIAQGFVAEEWRYNLPCMARLEDFAGSPDGLVLNALTKALDMVKGVERYIQDQQGEEQLDRDKQPLQVPQAEAESCPPAAIRRRIQIASSDLINRKISSEHVGGNEDPQSNKKQSWEDQMRERHKERREKIAREKEVKEQEERERVQREKLEKARARKEYIDNLAREKKETKETRAAESKRVKLEKLERGWRQEFARREMRRRVLDREKLKKKLLWEKKQLRLRAALSETEEDKETRKQEWARKREEWQEKKRIRETQKKEWETKVAGWNDAEEAEDGRKIFIGKLRFDDLTPEKAGSENMANLLREKRKQYYRDMFASFGSILCIKEHWDNQFVFVVYRDIEAAERAVRVMSCPEEKRKMVESIQMKLVHAGEPLSSAPRVSFYVRWPQTKETKKAKKAMPAREIAAKQKEKEKIATEKKETKEREKEAKRKVVEDELEKKSFEELTNELNALQIAKNEADANRASRGWERIEDTIRWRLQEEKRRWLAEAKQKVVDKEALKKKKIEELERVKEEARASERERRRAIAQEAAEARARAKRERMESLRAQAKELSSASGWSVVSARLHAPHHVSPSAFEFLDIQPPKPQKAKTLRPLAGTPTTSSSSVGKVAKEDSARKRKTKLNRKNKLRKRRSWKRQKHQLALAAAGRNPVYPQSQPQQPQQRQPQLPQLPQQRSHPLQRQTQPLHSSAVSLPITKGSQSLVYETNEDALARSSLQWEVSPDDVRIKRQMWLLLCAAGVAVVFLFLYV